MAEKQAHTPGPWAVNPIIAMVDAFDTGEPLPICALLWPTDERSEGETEANARLVAAAPDLLALAKRWAVIDAGSWAVDRHAAEKGELLAETRAIIAKAEGQP